MARKTRKWTRKSDEVVDKLDTWEGSFRREFLQGFSHDKALTVEVINGTIYRSTDPELLGAQEGVIDRTEMRSLYGIDFVPIHIPAMDKLLGTERWKG